MDDLTPIKPLPYIRIKYDVSPDYNEETDEYDPHLHRVVEKPTTSVDTFIHFLKGAIGTGLLAMPDSFRMAGLTTGAVFFAILAVLSTYLMHVLFYSIYVMSKRTRTPMLTFAQAMDLSLQIGPPFMRRFAKFSFNLVVWMMIVLQIGTLVVYVVFMSENFKDVIEYFTHKEITVEFYIAGLLFPTLGIVSIPNLKVLVPFSAGAHFLAIGAFGIVFYYIFTGLPPHSEVRKMPTSIMDLFLVFGTMAFAIQCPVVIVSAENNMKNPKSFVRRFGVLDLSYIVMTVVYGSIAYLGCWRYGENTQSHITRNSPYNVAGKICQLCYALDIYLSFSLHELVTVKLAWETYWEDALKGKCEFYMLYEYLIRVVFMLMAYLSAAVIPYLRYVLSLCGALCMWCLCYVFPITMDLCINYGKYGKFKYKLIRGIIILIVSLIAVSAGTYENVYNIVRLLFID